MEHEQDNRISKEVDSFSNTIGLVIYCAGPEPPVFAVSATKSGVVPDTGLYKRFLIK